MILNEIQEQDEPIIIITPYIRASYQKLSEWIVVYHIDVIW